MLTLALAAVVLVADAGSGSILTMRGASAVNRRAPPGSTVKPFVVWALLQEGVAPPAMQCLRKVRLQGRNLDCSHPQLAVPLDARTALAYSCNSYFTRLTRLIPPAKLAARLRSYGFEAGDAPTQEQAALQGIGEASVWTTPKALLASYRRLAKAPALDDIREGLEGAVEYGSGQWAAAPQIKVAGKTGTTPNLARTSTHAWFAGFAPSRQAEIVVVVFVEHGRGASNAAPLAGAVFRKHFAGQARR
jgi:penicillin-binding protein 2